MALLLPLATCYKLAYKLANLQIGYLHIGPFGPVLGLHDPVWCSENTLSVVAGPVVRAGTTAETALGFRTPDIVGPSRDERRW